MNQRERFLATVRFEPVDRPVFFPTIGFWPETIQRWLGEGLPGYVFHEAIGYPYFGFEPWVPMPTGDHLQPGFFPLFSRKVISRETTHRIVRDKSGKTFREFTDGSASIPMHIDSPVKNMDDFRALQWRLDPAFPARCVNPVHDAISAYTRVISAPSGILCSGLYGFHRHLMGTEALSLAYYDTPELIHTMSAAWERLVTGTIRRIKKHYPGTMFVSFWEDMCFVNGPLISPRTFRQFMTPYYKNVIDEAKNLGIEIFIVDTDGDCNLVIPLFVEVGINLLYPFEVQSGMDILDVRKRFPRLAIAGGLDKRVLAKSRKDIEAEVMLKVPEMLRHGGYIPAIDHNVPPDVPLDNFKYYLKLLKSIKA